MEKLLTIKELSETLSVSERTIRQWTHENYIPFLKLGHSVRFRERDIEIWLNKRAKQGRVRRRIEID
ncbi:helix-turn-helix domain-containing protein [bacterium]|nr:helix-turn-helix domain-containing protein [bacterium]